LNLSKVQSVIVGELRRRDQRAWHDFREAASIIHRLVEQHLKYEAGLSHAQWEVLSRLSAAPGGELRMTELKDAAVISKTGLTYQVRQLEEVGLVRRRVCESDGRGILAGLTPHGWAKVRELAPKHATLLHELFVNGLDRDRFAALAEGLAALSMHLLILDRLTSVPRDRYASHECAG